MGRDRYDKHPDKVWFLNKKEFSPIIEALERQWGFTQPFEYVFIRNAKDNVYIIQRSLVDVHIDDLKLNSLGIYFCEIQKRGDIRLSIEGSQLIGPHATKNILELNDKEADEWMKGYELSKPTPLNGYVIVKHKGDFMGCGYVIDSGDKIINYVPKTRRIHATINKIEDEENVVE